MTSGNAGRCALVISFSDLRADPRVHRQIALLCRHFKVTAAGHADPGVAGVEFVPVAPRHWSAPRKALAAALLKTGRFEDAYWSSRSVRDALAALRGRRFELIVANDILALPLAIELNRGGKVILDAHEYSPLEFEQSWKWRLFHQPYIDYLCRTYLPRADGMLTVCAGIAEAYRANYGVEPRVLINAPHYFELAPRPTASGQVRLVHHGAAIPARRLEVMIECMAHLDGRFHLDLFLVRSDSGYFGALEKLAATHPRVRILAPVPMQELPLHLNRYDMGVFLLPPTNFNYRLALPNKFFEFIQARLAIAIGPSPEMAALVDRYGCGVVSENFTPRALADRLNALDSTRIDHFKQQSHRAAADLNFEKHAGVLLEMIRNLLGNAACAG